MKKIKRIISALLVFILLLSSFSFTYIKAAYRMPTGVYEVYNTSLNVRSGPDTAYSYVASLKKGDRVTIVDVSGDWGKFKLNGSNVWISLAYCYPVHLKQHSISDEGLKFIKKYEGYYKYKYWDYSQWTIGYGTRCEENDYPDGISEPEAAALLKERLPIYEHYVDAMLNLNGIYVNQAQYDALVSVSFNAGNIWLNRDTKIKTMLIEGPEKYTTEQVHTAFNTTCITAGGNVLQGLINRRNGEADLFLSTPKVVLSAEGTYICPCGRVFEDRECKKLIPGVEMVYIPPEHSLSYVSSVPPSCVIEGNKEYYVCLDCGYRFTSMEATTIISDATLSPTGHTDDDKNGLCDVCGDLMFSDINREAWYVDGLYYCVERGYLAGVGEKTFSPSSSLTREQFMQILFNIAGEKAENWQGETGFDDAAEGKWYSPSVKWAKESGVTSGVDANNFGLKKAITREQFATLLYNYSIQKGKDVNTNANLSAYADAKQIAPWAYEGVSFCVANGLMSGTSSTILSPKTVANRVTAAQLFMNYDKYLNK